MNRRRLMINTILMGGHTPTYSEKIASTFGANLIGYWKLNEAAGNALDSSGGGHNLTNNGCTLGQPGVITGDTCNYYDGVNDVSNSAWGIAAWFNKDEGSLMAWVKVVVGEWTDGANRPILSYNDGGGGSLEIRKSWDNNKLAKTPGATEWACSDVAWMHLGITWSIANNQFAVYRNGALATATIAYAGCVERNQIALAAYAAGSGNLECFMAHVILLDRPATAAEMLTAATV